MTNNIAESAPVKGKGCSCLLALVVLFVLFFVAACAVLIYPAPVLRYVFSRVEAQSGIALTFESAQYGFGTLTFKGADIGSLTINGLAAKRQQHHADNFDLKAEKVKVSLMPSGIVQVSGLRGSYERMPSDLAVPNKGGQNENVTASPKNYQLVALLLEDAEVDFIDRSLEKLFQATIKVENFAALQLGSPSLFEPYACLGTGQIGSATFVIERQDDKQKIEFSEVPFGLLVPYASALDDIFVSGSMNMQIDDLSDKTQKRVRVSIWLLPDCRIKPANEIVAPAIQSALQTLDQSALNDVRYLKGQIDRLRKVSESWSAELEGVSRMMDSLGALVPRDIRTKYDKYKNQFDRSRSIYVEWDNLTQELDRLKIDVVEDTFHQFIASGMPIEIDLHEVDGVWQYDTYAIVVRLVENNYRTVLSTKYQSRIQEIRNAVDLLLRL